jgi:hypothetical protein
VKSPDFSITDRDFTHAEDKPMSDIYLPTLISEALLAFSGLFGGVSISFFGSHNGCTSIVDLSQA